MSPRLITLAAATAALVTASPAAAQEPPQTSDAGVPFKTQAVPALAVAQTTDALQAGDRGSVTIVARRPGRCQLAFRGPGKTTAGPFRARFTRRYGTWTWRVPRTARGGTWTAKVHCVRRGHKRRHASARLSVAVTGGAAPIARRKTVKSISSRTAPAPTTAPLQGGKGAGTGYPNDNALCQWTGARNGDCHNAARTSFYDWGYKQSDGRWSTMSARGFTYRNCTDFAAWAAGLTWSSFKFAPGTGNAIHWKDYAAKAGLKVRSTADVGDIAWWGTSRGIYGHVAIVTAVNPDGTVSTADYNGDRRGNYTIHTGTRADAYLHRPGGTTINSPGGGTETLPPVPPAANAALKGFQIGFQGSDSQLWNVGVESRQLPYGMAAGTSPAIAALSGGGLQMAFHAADHQLWTVGTAATRKLPYGMAAGASPSIAGLTGGGWQAAFAGADGALWTVGTAESRKLPYGVKAGTSPSITALADGGWQIAFQAADGRLWTVGTADSRDLPYGMAAGTSPAITGLVGGGWQVAFQASDGRLWTVGAADSRDLSYGVAARTSPAIAALSGGGFQIAFHGSDGALWSVGSADSRKLPYGMAGGTSPAIAAVGGGWQIAFHASDGQLWTAGTAESRTLPYGIAAGTSPTIAPAAAG